MAKILIVDDDIDIVNLLKRHLISIPAKIMVANDGYEALWHLSQGEEPDTVILDIRMPGRSGLDLLCAIKARWPAAKVYMFTSYSDYKTKFDFYDYISGFFIKNPEQIAELVAAIKGDALC